MHAKLTAAQAVSAVAVDLQVAPGPIVILTGRVKISLVALFPPLTLSPYPQANSHDV